MIESLLQLSRNNPKSASLAVIPNHSPCRIVLHPSLFSTRDSRATSTSLGAYSIPLFIHLESATLIGQRGLRAWQRLRSCYQHRPSSINLQTTSQHPQLDIDPLIRTSWLSHGRPLASRTRTNLIRASNTDYCSYNRYLAVAARVVRRSLKEDKRLQAEKRGEMDLRFAKWSVSGRCRRYMT